MAARRYTKKSYETKKPKREINRVGFKIWNVRYLLSSYDVFFFFSMMARVRQVNFAVGLKLDLNWSGYIERIKCVSFLTTLQMIGYENCCYATREEKERKPKIHGNKGISISAPVA